MKFFVVVLLAVSAIHAAPVSELETYQVQVEIQQFLAEAGQPGTDIRDLLERWIKGDHSIKHHLQNIADFLQGKVSIQEVQERIQEVFGSVSMIARGLILLVRNVGVNAFAMFINKILGRDDVPAPNAIYEMQPY